MPAFDITTPDGQGYRVDAPDERAAMDALSTLQNTATLASDQANYDPQGLEGSAYNQVRGWLHGFSSALGAPVDVVNAALKKVGLPVSDMPLLGSASIRSALDVPGRAAGAALDAVFGGGTAKKYGLMGHATYADINEVPEAYRPQARAGEVLGATLPFIAAPVVAGGLALGGTGSVAEMLAAARTPGASAIGNVARSELARAAQPGFAKTLVPAALGGAAGAYGAEVVFPGSETAQLIGQLAGGVAGAGGEIGAATAAGAARNRISEPLSTLTESGAAKAIARALEPQFQKAGEDVDRIIRNLQTPEIVAGASPAERSGSRVLMGVQETLTKKDPELANVLAETRGRYRENLSGAFAGAFEPGQPSALSEAAKTRQVTFQSYLDGLTMRAEAQAAEAADAAAPLGAADRELANMQARNNLEDALASARSKEKEIWATVDGTKKIATGNIIDAYRSVKKEMLPGARLPAEIENYLRKLSQFKQSSGGTDPLQPLGSIQTLRSELLNEARKARAAEDFALARRLNIIANGPRGQTGGALGDMAAADDKNLPAALDFSRQLNEQFSQGFAGDVLGMKASGQEAIRPGLTLEAAATGRPQVAAEKFKELRQATVPIGAPEGAAAAPEMVSAQENYLRSLSQRIIDPASGRIKPKQASAFMRDYAGILDQFPDYRLTLQRATAAQMAADNIGIRANEATKAAQSAAFSKVLGAGELPSDAIRKAINGSNPGQDLKKIASLARSGGPASLGGLRAAVLEHVMDEASTSTGISFQNTRQILSTPIAPGQPGLLAWLARNGVFSQAQVDNITEKIAQGVRHETASQSALRVDSVGDEAGKIARWGARILGAKLASRLGATGGGAGPSLQVAQVAASAAESALARMPVDRARRIISEAMQQTDPQKLLEILQRIGSVEARQIERQVSPVPFIRPLVPESKSRPRMLSPADIAAGRGARNFR